MALGVTLNSYVGMNLSGIDVVQLGLKGLLYDSTSTKEFWDNVSTSIMGYYNSYREIIEEIIKPTAPISVYIELTIAGGTLDNSKQSIENPSIIWKLDYKSINSNGIDYVKESMSNFELYFKVFAKAFENNTLHSVAFTGALPGLLFGTDTLQHLLSKRYHANIALPTVMFRVLKNDGMHIYNCIIPRPCGYNMLFDYDYVRKPIQCMIEEYMLDATSIDVEVNVGGLVDSINNITNQGIDACDVVANIIKHLVLDKCYNPKVTNPMKKYNEILDNVES